MLPRYDGMAIDIIDVNHLCKGHQKVPESLFCALAIPANRSVLCYVLT